MVTKVESQITKRVIRAREEAGLRRKEVADALGLEEQSYGHYERGRYAFTVEQLLLLSRTLNKPVTWFLGIKTDLAEDEEELLHAYWAISDDRIKALLLNMAKDASKDE
jgi:transcriptional regulator with XRE-family HTH domain